MSYRTYVEGKQIFGNNDCFSEWIKFIKSQGIEVGEDGDYEGEITDFQGALKVLENIVLQIERDNKEFGGNSLFDISDIYNEFLEEAEAGWKYHETLVDKIYWKLENGYVFIPYYFIEVCKEKLNCNYMYPHEYRLKEGQKISVRAY